MSIPVAILAGGRGTRIADIAGQLPKALVPVNGRPFLDHQLRWLSNTGTTEVVLCIGYRAESIEAFVETGAAWGLKVTYSNDGDAPLGTGGAIARALPLLGETFATVYGDAILQCDPTTVARSLEAGDDGVMTVFENGDRWIRSNVRVANGRVTAYDKEAPPGSMDHIDYGISIFRAKAFRESEANQPFDLSVVHRALIARATLRAFRCADRWYEIGTPEGLRETEAFLRTREITKPSQRDA